MKHFTPIMYLLLSTVLLLLTAVFTLPLGNAQASPQPDATTDFDCTQVSEISQVECEALVALYNATDGPNWTDQTDWLVTNTPCSWYGVYCYEGYINNIDLHSNHLSGAVPPEIDNLTPRFLNLNDNQLTAVPPEIGNMNSLWYLFLNDNQLTAVPPEIGNLTYLWELHLSSNQLTAVPPEIGNLSSLTSLTLENNQLTSVPSGIGSLSSLSELNLEGNQLTSLPPEIGNLTSLWQFSLGGNQLTAVPPEIGNLSSLSYLDLGYNQLAVLPPEIGNLSSLTSLRLYSNQLTAIPAEIGNLTNLTYLFLNDNPLSGTLPDFLSSLEQLDLFYFFNTGWCVPALGPTTDWLSGISTVSGTGVICSQPFIGCTDVTGIPQVECEALVAFYNATDGPNWGVQTNWLATNTPCTWYGITCSNGHVSRLALDRNDLSGGVPPEIGNLSSLEWLGLGYNQLTAVPPEIGNLSNLEWLSLWNNQLTAVPPEIGNLVNLSVLGLSDNQLTAIPSEIGNMVNLTDLYLNNNQLTAVPPEIWNMVNLSVLYLSKNQLATVPPEIGNLVNLTYLYLSDNQLTAVPSEIGNLINLDHFGLAGNHLMTLPSEIGNLINLSWLFLDRNPFTGSLPQSFTSFTQLDIFTFYDTGWCIPDDTGLQTWLAGISEVHGTGLRCGQPAGAFSGLVTNAQGAALPNAQVVLYRPAPWSSRIVVSSTQTNGLGQYAFTDLGQGINYYLHFQDGTGAMAPEYHENKGTLGTADPITATLGFTRTINAQLNIAPPPLVTVGLGSGSATSSVNPLDGTVHINVPPGGAADLTLTFAATCKDNSVPSAVVLSYNGQTYPMTASGSSYQATIPAANVTASASLTITTTCNGTGNPVTVGTITLYDPSGTITDASTQQPVVGAKVTLYQVPGWLPRTGPNDTRPNTCESNTSKPAGAPWSQPAPTDQGIRVNTQLTQIAPLVGHQYTNNAGYYGWDVPEGCWYVIVEAEGYEKLVSPVVGVPPAVLDLDLALTPTMQFVYLPMIMRP